MNTIVMPSLERKMHKGTKTFTASKVSYSGGGSGHRKSKGKAVTKEKENPMMNPNQVPQYF